MLVRNCRRLIVLDPYGSDGWPTGAIFCRTINRVIFWAKRKRGYVIVIDEAGYALDRYRPEHEQLATRSAHRQHRCVFVCQRYSQISPVVRFQCSEYWLFPQDYDSERQLAREAGLTLLPCWPPMTGGNRYAMHICDRSAKIFKLDLYSRLDGFRTSDKPA